MRSIRLLITILVLAFSALPATSAPQVQQQVVFDHSWGEAGFNLSRSDRGGVELVFSLPSLTLTPVTVAGEAFTQVSIPGAMLPTGPGMPNLPGAGRLVAVPNGATVRVEVLQSRTQTLTGINVLPAARIPLETEPTPLPVKDPAIYSTDAVWPAQPVTLSPRRHLRGVETRMLGITPFGYNPVTGELTVYTDLRIRLTFSGGKGTVGTERLRSRHWDPILERQLLNFDLLPKVDYSGRDYLGLDGVEYLVVVPDDPDFISWGQTLTDFRKLQGISSQVFTVTEMGGNTAAAIESFIDDAYATWATVPVAVLFLGDYVADGQPGGVTSPNNGGYISDNVYADVDGDHLPDLVTSRITARDAAELELMINKVLEYEQSPPTTPGFYDNPMVACGFQTERWFQICTEIVRGFWENELGKSPVRQYNVYSGSPDPGDPWSTNQNTWMLVDHFGTAGLNYIPDTQPAIDWNSGSAAGINDGINAGCFILQHRDHGGETGWGEPDYGISDLAGLSNDMLPWVFSINCLTGRFNITGECFAEAFHRMEGGALGITAATDVSYSFVNDTYVFGTYDSLWPDFDPSYPTTGRAVGRDDLRPAFANVSGKYFLEASNWPYNPDSKEITYYLFHAHADPFTTLFSEVPVSMSVTHGSALLSMVPFFTVTAPAGSLIALTRDGEILGVADGIGAPVDVVIPGQLPGLPPVKVTVTLANCYRYGADVEVIPPSGPYVAFSDWSIDDSGGNGNGLLDAGETVDLTVTLRNYGVDPATSVAATISCGDPLVTVHAASVSYGDIDAGAMADGSGTFLVELDVDCPDGRALGFNIDVTADGGHEWASAFSLVGQSDPDLAVSPTTLEPVCYEGVATTGALLIENLGTRELDWSFLAGAPWIAADPVSGQVAPGGSTAVTIYFDAANLPAGIHTSAVILESNDPDENPLNIPVTFTVQPSPILFYLNHRIDDDDVGESQGNGNGNPEAGETIELQVSLVNRGTVTASGVSATLFCDDPYILLTDTVEAFPNIDPGQAGTSLDDFGFVVQNDCPLEYQVQLGLLLTANEGPQEWVDGFICYITSTLNAVTGQVTDLDSGQPVEAAVVTLTGAGDSRTFGTNDQGCYFAYGLEDGDFTIQVGAAGYSDAFPVEVTLPPNAEADFALGFSDIAPTPDTLTATLPPHGELDQTFSLANLGNFLLTWDIEVDGAGVGIQEEPFGNTSNSFSGSNRMRGNLYEVDTETLLREVRCYLSVNSPTTLIYAVYEGDSVSAPLDKIFEATVEEPGGGAGWYSSGPMSVDLDAGKYYFIGTAWDTSCGYYRGSDYPPLPTSFGSLLDGDSSSFPPPAQFSAGGLGGSPYYHAIVTGTGYWADPEPGEGVVDPAGTSELTVHFNAFDLAVGQHTAQFLVWNNDPDENPLVIPLTLDVYDGPTLAHHGHLMDDDNLGSSSGDGDGHLEAGETIEVPVTLVNTGAVAAQSVIASIEVNDCAYVTLGDTSETFGDIPAGGTAVSLDDFDLTLSPITPTGTTFTVELTIQCAGFTGVWHDSFEMTVESVSVISGLVTDLGNGSPVAGAEVHYSGPVSGTATSVVDGTYSITGLVEGTYTLQATGSGYSPADPVQLTVPPDGTADFALGAADIAATPDTFSVSLSPWSELVEPLELANLGNVPLDYQIEVNGAGVGIQEEIFGSTSSTYSGSNRIRGNVYHVDMGTLLRETRFLLTLTAETTLVHAIYQGDSLTGTYNRIFEVQVSEQAGGQTWYSSGPVELELEEGKFYFVCCAWDSSCTYYRGSGSPPYPASFGTLETGVGDNIYPPPDPYSQTSTSLAAYHQMLITGTGYWAEPDILAGTVEPGGAHQLTVNFQSMDLSIGSHNAEFLVHTNDPDENPLLIPLSIEVIDGPVLAYQEHLVDDDSQGSSQGDGDGCLEAGESVEIPLTLINSGGSAAPSVTATIEVNDCAFVTVTDDSEAFNDIPAGGSGTTVDDFDLTISPSCPSGTIFTVELTIACDGFGGVWHSSFEMIVQSVNRISGLVDDVSSGSGLEGAVVSYTGPVSGSVSAGQGGWYDIVGLGAGAYTLVASADGYIDSDPVDVSLPPDTQIDFHLGLVHVSVTPAELQLTVYEESWETTALFIGNSGTVDLEFQLQSDVGWISFQPDSGQVPPGGSAEVQVTFAAGGQGTGSLPGMIQVLSNDPDNGAVAVPALMLVYRELILTGPGPAYANPALVRTFRRTPNDWFEPADEFTAYSADHYGVNVAAADIDGDLFDEIITGPGPGRSYGPLVQAYEMEGTPVDGGAVVFMAYGTLNYGVGVAGGDLDGDGRDEIITGAGPGAVFGPHARAFSYDPVSRVVTPLPGVSFLAYNTNKFGVNITAGDVDADGCDEIITGPGPGSMFGPHLRGWNVDGDVAAAIPQINRFAYDSACRFGIRVACGDLDGDGRDEIVTGPGPDPAMGPRVCGWSYSSGSLELMPGVDFFAYNETSGYGVVVACGDLDDDGIDEILTVPGPGEAFTCHIRGFNYDGVVLTDMPRINFIAYDPSLVRQGGRMAAGAFGEE